MDFVQQCFDITKKLLQTLNEMTESNRDEKIEAVEVLMEERQQLFSHIQHPFSEAEMELGKEIMKLNQVIDTKMNLVQVEIKRDMNNLNKKKSGVKKYTNPYESLQFDGMFYDKKK